MCNELLKREKEKEEIVGGTDTEDIVVIGADVEALFPSLISEIVGRVIREAVIKSRIQLEDFNYKEMARYIRMGDKYRSNVGSLDRVLPVRRFVKGTTPGITGNEVLGNKDDDEIRWIFPVVEVTEKEKKEMFATALEIGTRALFENYVYQFGGKSYQQKKGGPIGMRVTMAASRVMMGEWGEEFTKIMMTANINVYMKCLYVDDIRIVVSVMKKGTRWNPASKCLEYREEWELEEKDTEESNTSRMSRLLRPAMSSIYEGISLTMEIAEDFKDQKLPTLDFNLYLEDGELRYSYFEKEMKTPFCITEKSAMCERSKMSILSNDLIRRCMNTCEKTSQEDKNMMVEEYIDRLKASGYNRKQVREVITSGLTGYTSKVRRAELEERPLHRPAHSTLANRHKKKLTEKTSWYKPRKDKKLEEKIHPPERKIKKKDYKKDHRNFEVRAVMFVPRTKGGVLATRLREAEEKLAEITGYKVKVVERGGMMILRCLHKANPWDGQDCEREDCLLCTSQAGGDQTKQSCKRRNIVYATVCQECHQVGKVVKYVGESCRSAYERGREHVTDYENLSLDSHMLKHNILYHPEKQKVEFKMKIVEAHKNAFTRQIHEAVEIEMASTGGIVMNSKSEYNRCALPRLTVDGKTGKVVGGGGKADQVYLTDEELDARIVKLRKERKMRQRAEERSKDDENMWKTGVIQGGTRKKLKMDNEMHRKRGRWRKKADPPISKNKKIRLGSEIADEVVCDKKLLIGDTLQTELENENTAEDQVHTPVEVVKVATKAALSGGQSVREIKTSLEAKFGSRCQNKQTGGMPKPMRTPKPEIQIQSPKKSNLKPNFTKKSIKKLEITGQTKSILNYFEPSRPLSKESPAKINSKIQSLKNKLGSTSNSSRKNKPKPKPKPSLSPNVQRVIENYFKCDTPLGPRSATNPNLTLYSQGSSTRQTANLKGAKIGKS